MSEPSKGAPATDSIGMLNEALDFREQAGERPV